MSTFEKSVKGATKPKLAPPKSKYISHILESTRAGESGVGEVLRVLSLRIRDTTWTISFKALIVVHLMMREGEPNVTLRYLSTDARKIISLHAYADVQTQGKNIRTYSQYIMERALAFQKVHVDYVLNGKGRLKSLSVDKGLLRETEIVQDQIQMLIKCDLMTEEPENEITIAAYRLLIMDLLVLYQVMNEGTICVLEHYFEMSKPDAERALEIYKAFAKLTESVVRFLTIARHHQNSTHVEIPKLQHAPTSLAKSLEEYLNDPDFEMNRRQHLAQQQAKKGIKPTDNATASSNKAVSRGVDGGSKLPTTTSTSTSTQPAASQPRKGPAPDLIDFFESIENNQQPMAQNEGQFQQQSFAPQYTGFVQQPAFSGQLAPQSTGNPFMQFQQQPLQAQYTQQPQIQPQFTGAGFGGYGPQPDQQQNMPQPQFPQASGFDTNGSGLDQFGQQPFNGQQVQPLQEQSTNPFRKSMMPNQVTSPTQMGQQSARNPFARTIPIPEENAVQDFNSSFAPQPSANQSSAPPSTQVQSPLQAQPTGTNPFSRAQSPPANQSQQPGQPGSLVSSPTGSTNPFKNSAFVNQQTGLGWQTVQQGSMGGLETLETKPVFPRPGQPQQVPQPFGQPQQQNSPW